MIMLLSSFSAGSPLDICLFYLQLFICYCYILYPIPLSLWSADIGWGIYFQGLELVVLVIQIHYNSINIIWGKCEKNIVSESHSPPGERAVLFEGLESSAEVPYIRSFRMSSTLLFDSIANSLV